MERKLIHTINYPIRWGDMDAYGHVNNTVYFAYTQEARFSILKENNIPILPEGKSPVLGETACRFIRPIVFPETLVINTYVKGIIGKKIFFEHELRSSENTNILFATVTATVVWFDFNTRTSCDIPHYVVDVFLKN